MNLYEDSIKTFLKPGGSFKNKILFPKSKTRNQSIKSKKSKTKYNNISYTQKKSNIINIYPNNISNISFDYSNNNEYNLLNYGTKNNKIDNFIQEKNKLIKDLQNQNNNYVLMIKENNKKLNIQEQIITSLKQQIKQLNNDITRKNNIIEQNEDFDYKISKLKKDVEKSRDKKLSDDYLESKKYNNILVNKINNYKQEIKEKNDEINKLKTKNDYLLKLKKENELKLENKNIEINKLYEENILIKKNFEELEKNFTILSNQFKMSDYREKIDIDDGYKNFNNNNIKNKIFVNKDDNESNKIIIEE